MAEVSLLSLPADLLRLVASTRPGAAGVMVRTCRRLHTLVQDIVPRFVEKDISPVEYWNHGLRFAQRRRMELQSPDEVVFTEYVMVIPDTIGLYTVMLYAGKGGYDRFQESTNVYSTAPGTTGRCTRETRDTIIAKGEVYDAAIADMALSEVRKDVSRVLPGKATVRDILRHRRGCKPDEEMVGRLMRRGMRRLLRMLEEPVLDHLLQMSEWTQENLKSFEVMVRGTERDILRCMRIYATIVLLDGYSRGGDRNTSPCHDLQFSCGTPNVILLGSQLGFALIRIGYCIGITTK